MSRKALLLVVLLCAGLTGTLAATAAGPLFADDPPAIPGQPYSAGSETTSTTLFTDGNRIVRNNTTRYFRDSRGRTRVERGLAALDGSGTQTNGAITIDDPVKSQRYILNTQLRTALVYKTDAGKPAPVGGAMVALESAEPFALLGLRMALGASATTESASDSTTLGQKVVNGLLATGTRTIRTIPSGVLGNEKPITSTLDRWVSTDLGVTVQITEQSSIGGTVVFNLGQIERGEPDPALFSIPADYTRHEIHLPIVPAAGGQ